MSIASQSKMLFLTRLTQNIARCGKLTKYPYKTNVKLFVTTKQSDVKTGICSACNYHTTRQYTTKTAEEKTSETHFGFETVSEDAKEERVHEVFHRVAESYDLMNDVMSGGVHRLWKDHFMAKLSPRPGTKLLDVAGGTGDIAFRFLKYVENQTRYDDSLSDNFDIELPKEVEIEARAYREDSSSSSSDSENDMNDSKATHVTVCDINQAMLDVGKRRAERAGFVEGISWLKGNAECLPVQDNSYDAYTIAFGIRNCTHIDRVLEEAHRVLKPGGRFMCLEFSRVSNPIIRKLYDEYSFQVIPVMGQVIAKDWKSYQYLVESIRKFPNQEEFSDMISSAGFKCVTHENLMLGVAAIHSGFKL